MRHVFKLIPPSQQGGKWTEKVLHQFDGNDGSNSSAGVVFGVKGNLYGTTSAGATNGSGAVFDLAAPTGGRGLWNETVLYHFSDGNDGANPTAGLIFDAGGNLYGTAYRGLGGSLYGDVFRLKPPSGKGGSWTLSVLYGFNTRVGPGQPASKLTRDNIGNLYGTSQYGGTGTGCGSGSCGTVFEVSP